MWDAARAEAQQRSKMIVLFTVAIGLSVLLIFVFFDLYYKCSGLYMKWKLQGVPGPPPKSFLGNCNIFRLSAPQLFYKLYYDYPKEKFVGFYEFSQPRLLLRDPEIIRRVLQDDFSAFSDRAAVTSFSNGPLEEALFTMCGDKWKYVRSKLSPAFSVAQLRLMFGKILDSSTALTSYLDKHLDRDVELKDLAFTFATDVIGSTTFGIDVKSESHSRVTFKQMAKRAFYINLPRVIKLVIMANFPKLGEYLKLTFSDPEVTEYMDHVLDEAFNKRANSQGDCHDLTQSLVQLKEKGKVEATFDEEKDAYLQMPETTPQVDVEMTDNLVKSQAFTILSTGSETTANTLLFALYELARNPMIQRKAREEVNAAISKHGGLSYDAVEDMPFLEDIIKETLRIYPVSPQLMRKCTKPPYVFTEGLTVDSDVGIVIPVKALHHDPLYFDDPFDFKPERFQKEADFVKGTYLPFGMGPRMCLGMRMAILALKVSLASLLHSYILRESPKTSKPIEMSKWSLSRTPSGPVWLTITKM